jgi:hypothetical protein
LNEKESAWQKYKKNLGDSRPWDLINPHVEKALEEEAKTRLDICKACPELIQLSTTCKKCGCFMQAKVKIKRASCPLGKW